MSAFKLPRFIRRNPDRPSIIARARALKASTAKILHLPGKAGLDKSMAAHAASVSDTSGDPVLAALQAHRAAHAAHVAAIGKAGRYETFPVSERTPEAAAALKAAEARVADAIQAEDEAWRNLFTTRPTSLAELIEVIRYAARWEHDYRAIDDEPDILAFIADALEDLASPKAPEPAPGAQPAPAQALAPASTCHVERLGREYTMLSNLLAEMESAEFTARADFAAAERARDDNGRDKALGRETEAKHLREALYDRSDAIVEEASFYPAGSALGAMYQLLLASHEADTIAALGIGLADDDDRSTDERRATKGTIKGHQRRVDRLFHSAVSHLEQALAISAKCVGRDMLLPERLDWHRQAMAMLAERLADKGGA